MTWGVSVSVGTFGYGVQRYEAPVGARSRQSRIVLVPLIELDLELVLVLGIPFTVHLPLC